MSKLLIGVPLYLNTTGIRRTLLTDGDYEILCLHDANNDTTCGDVKIEDERVSILAGAQTGNPIDNWNATLDQIARRENVARCILMHHDEALIEKIESCEIQGLAKNEIGIIQHRNGEKKVLSNRIKCSFINFFPSVIRIFNFIGPVGLLILPSNIQNRFDNRLKWYVDTEFYYQLSAHYKFIPIQSGLVASLENPNSITNKLTDISVQASKERKMLGIRLANARMNLLKITYHLLRKVFGRYY